MPRWSVVAGDQELFFEATADGMVSLHVPTGRPMVLSPEQAEDARLKLGAAIDSARDTSGR